MGSKNERRPSLEDWGPLGIKTNIIARDDLPLYKLVSQSIEETGLGLVNVAEHNNQVDDQGVVLDAQVQSRIIMINVSPDVSFDQFQGFVAIASAYQAILPVGNEIISQSEKTAIIHEFLLRKMVAERAGRESGSTV